MRRPTLWSVDASQAGLAALRRALDLPAAVSLHPLGEDVLLRIPRSAADRLRVDGRPLGPGQRVLLGGEVLRLGGRRVRVVARPPGGARGDAGTRTLARAALAGEPAAPEGPSLVVLEGPAAGRRWPLRPGAQWVGRGLDADVVLVDGAVSRRHACLEVGARSCRVRDAGSRHGLLVDGRRCRAGHRLRGGEELRLGRTRLRYLPAPVTDAVLVGAARPASAPPRAAVVAAGLLALGGALTAGTLLPW